jgi:hypothetical protein
LACRVEREEPLLLDGITNAAAGLKITAGFTCFKLAKPFQSSGKACNPAEAVLIL